MEKEEAILCPFCGFRADGDYQIMLHMETLHAEGGDSPFVAKDDASIAALIALDDKQDAQYASCPVEGCGEAILLTELESHVEMHGEEQLSSEESGRSSKRLKMEANSDVAFDSKLSHALRNLDDVETYGMQPPHASSSDHQTSVKAVWRGLLRMPEKGSKPAQVSSPSKGPRKRLGKSELGPHANEKQMPSWLVKLLEEDGATKLINSLDDSGKLKKVKFSPNMTDGIVPILEQLLDQDEGVSYAYLCDPVVKHVSKLRREGGFCGYRNIQMMCSYIIGAKSQGHGIFEKKIPTIFQIQEYIEQAWDLGINAQGRIETGGIRGTRKYIGTPDAQAMFCSLGISCDAQGLKSKGNSKPAYELLLNAVENYFSNNCLDYNPKLRCTTLPPIYFQHPGHSLTVVGIEKKIDGSRNLIVFDPMFHDASNITKLIGHKFKTRTPADMLRAYRRGFKYLKKYNEFELLKLSLPKAQHQRIPPLA